MKLSEAIRLGAMLRPQTYGRLFRDGATCAKGAACEATGFAYRDDFIPFGAAAHLLECFPALPMIDRALCPACGVSAPLGTIAHLNDHPHCWTREAIADWVATIEPADAPVPDTPIEVLVRP